MQVDQANILPCAAAADFALWLAENHADATEVWVQMFKKQSGIASITWEEAVIEALAWGWIDGIKKSNDAQSWFQRFTPRRSRSSWSAKNVAHAEKLMAEGRMQPPGQRTVDEAKADGRWDVAYAGSSEMIIPEYFLSALAKNAKAQKTFDTLNRSNLFAIYHRLHTARTDATRNSRMVKIIETLARGEPLV